MPESFVSSVSVYEPLYLRDNLNDTYLFNNNNTNIPKNNNNNTFSVLSFISKH